jgi:hypothetical protein
MTPDCQARQEATMIVPRKFPYQDTMQDFMRFMNATGRGAGNKKQPQRIVSTKNRKKGR